MSRIVPATFLSIAILAGSAAAAGKIDVTIDGVDHGHFPKDSVTCLPDGHGQSTETGHDSSPGVRWTAGPGGTKSYAVLMTDPDVPADTGNLNKPGVTVPANVPRVPIYHWVLIDIPADRTHLSPGDGNVFAEVFGTPVEMRMAKAVFSTYAVTAAPARRGTTCGRIIIASRSSPSTRPLR